MRVRTLEIRWHDSPIYSLDYQTLPAPQLRKIFARRMQREPSSSNSSSAPPSVNAAEAAQTAPPTFRLATAGGDNLVRVWMVHPNILPAAAKALSTQPVVPHPPRVEYLATLSKHTATVNVVRFSPTGEYIASAGDDGVVVVWAPSDKPSVSYGSDTANEEAEYSKEFWRARIIIRCTTREVYDLAWSPNSEWIVAGSTDNTARIFNAVDGTCLREISEHSHYVQGVAWDPLNEFIATQSSDRSVHVYGINTKRGSFEVHAMGKNTRMPVRHSRTPSNTPQLATPQTQSNRPHYKRRGSTTSEADSVITSASELREDPLSSFGSFLAASQASSSSSNALIGGSGSGNGGLHLDTAALKAATNGPPTPTASVVSSASAMFPPKEALPAARSRRSSFSSTTNAPSPSVSSRGNFGRSPSPMPPLPAIRTPAATPSWASVKLYGDENFTNFFRRLTFSPDGGLLLTPAGQFEDPSVTPGMTKQRGDTGPDDLPVQPKKQSSSSASSSSSSVFIYTRANFARPPVAHLPGHKTASIAVRFSPVLYELRQGVAAPGQGSKAEVKKIVIEKGKEHDIELDLGSATPASASAAGTPLYQPTAKPASSSSQTGPLGDSGVRPPPSPAPSASSRRAATPSLHPPPSASGTASVFALPYRMLFAVATQDTVMIYDTQQSGPICMFTNLHYSAFTDVAWAPDGQSLMLASSDGYCSIVLFDEYLPLYHTQQHNIQMQAIASSVSTPQHHHVPLPGSGTGAHSLKRSEPSADEEPLIPMAPLISVTTPESTQGASGSTPTTQQQQQQQQQQQLAGGDAEGEQPKKKKRRIQPTHLGGIDS